MQRRSFIKNMLALSVLSPMASSTLYASDTPYSGPIFINIMARSGLDQSSFCDPKNDVVVNKWAQTQGYGQAGNIRYAPIGDNKIFFDKYYKYMMVINGIDLSTNAHTAATRHRFSGKLAAGYPNISEVIAEDKAKGYPLAYVSGGGYKYNLGYVPFSQLPSVRSMNELSDTNNRYKGKSYVKRQEADMVSQARQDRILRLQEKGNLLPRREMALRLLQRSFEGRELISGLQDYLPESIDQVDLQGNKHNLIPKAHQALIAAKAGLTACIDLTSSDGFDSHNEHDAYFEEVYPNFTNGIDYIWTKAEELGIADRIIMHVLSDVGRTPFYNSGNGKNHWRHASSIFMKKNASWGNRVVGATDGGLFSQKINPSTLELDENGIVLEPKHVIQAYRELAGVQGSALALRYPLEAQSVNFFNSNFQTGYMD